jgi:hypothetical protein
VIEPQMPGWAVPMRARLGWVADIGIEDAA